MAPQASPRPRKLHLRQRPRRRLQHRQSRNRFRPRRRPNLHRASRNLQLLTLYEQRINRILAKNTARLESLQSARKAAFAQAQAEALLLFEWTQSHGEVYHPTEDFPPSEDFGGFVYSTAEIARLIDRGRRLEAAVNFAAQARKSPVHRQAPSLHHSKAA